MTRTRFSVIVITDKRVELPFHYAKLTSAVRDARLYKKTPQVREVFIQDEFDIFWKWTPEQGEIQMGKFAQAVQEARGGFMGSTIKKMVAEHEIPFTVIEAAGKIRNLNFRTDEWTFRVAFTPAQIADYPELQNEMTLTFTSNTKAKREDKLIALTDEVREDGPVANVLLTYNPNVGNAGWYDVEVAS